MTVEIGKRRFTILAIHILAGILLFYFLIHPLAMVVNAGNEVNSTTNGMWDEVIFQFAHSFSFHMLPMTYVFIVAGAIIGLLSGIFRLDFMIKRLRSEERTSSLDKSAEELIAGGENHYVEFKSSIRYDFRQKSTNRSLEEVIAKTLAGFMNADGGNLVVGVKDNGEILGLEMDYITLRNKNQDGLERRIFELVSSRIGAEFCQLCTVLFQEVSGKPVCLIRVKASAEPVYINERDTTAFFVRVGNATHQLSVRETVKYIKMKENKKNDTKTF